MHTCPPNKTAVIVAALLERPALFSLVDHRYWAQSRLPTAGKNAQALVEIIRLSMLSEDSLDLIE